MKWGQFKDPVSHMCLAGVLVASWSVTQEVAGLSPFTVITNIFVTEFRKKPLMSLSNDCRYYWFTVLETLK